MSIVVSRWRHHEEWHTVCERYAVSIDGGFLPEVCIAKLEYPELQVWERLIAMLPELNRLGTLTSEVEAMPVCSTKSLKSEAELQRAYIVLCHLLHSYVHHAKVPWDFLSPSAKSCSSTAEVQKASNASHDGSICDQLGSNPANAVVRVPPQLAVPLSTVCKKLGLPPVLTAAIDLWNWRQVDNTASASKHVLSLRVLSSMTGTETEAFFHLVPCSIQAHLGPVVIPMFLSPSCLFSSLLPCLSTHALGGQGYEAEVAAGLDEFGHLLRRVCFCML